MKTLKEWGIKEGIKDMCMCVCVCEREGEMVLFKIPQIFNLSLCIEG